MLAKWGLSHIGWRRIMKSFYSPSFTSAESAVQQWHAEGLEDPIPVFEGASPHPLFHL